MKELLLVGAGGFIGSILRFQVGEWLLRASLAKFPCGTLAVNLIGCLLIGLLGGVAEKRAGLSADVRLLLVVGLLGGFTTFSAFGFDTMLLLRRDKLLPALLNVVLNVVGGLLMVWLGLKAAGVTAPKS